MKGEQKMEVKNYPRNNTTPRAKDLDRHWVFTANFKLLGTERFQEEKLIINNAPKHPACQETATLQDSERLLNHGILVPASLA